MLRVSSLRLTRTPQCLPIFACLFPRSIHSLLRTELLPSLPILEPFSRPLQWGPRTESDFPRAVAHSQSPSSCHRPLSARLCEFTVHVMGIHGQIIPLPQRVSSRVRNSVASQRTTSRILRLLRSLLHLPHPEAPQRPDEAEVVGVAEVVEDRVRITPRLIVPRMTVEDRISPAAATMDGVTDPVSKKILSISVHTFLPEHSLLRTLILRKKYQSTSILSE